MLSLLLVVQGDFGLRFVANIKKYAPSDWKVEYVVFPSKISVSEDDSLEDFVPKDLPACDLLLMLQEEPVVAEMTPYIVKNTGAKAVIAPIDNKAFLSTGLARQIKNKLAKVNVEMIYPMTFCALTEKNITDPLILEFTKYFGRPIVEIKTAQDKLTEMLVTRDAPCGNTRYVAEHIVGTHIKDVVEKSGILHHNHPCMSTMVMDNELKDTLMHHAGLQIKLASEEAIKRK